MEYILLEAPVAARKPTSRLFTALRSLQIAGVTREKGASSLRYTKGTWILRIYVDVVQLRRQACLHSVQVELLHLCLACRPYAFDTWMPLMLGYVRSAPNALECLLCSDCDAEYHGNGSSLGLRKKAAPSRDDVLRQLGKLSAAKLQIFSNLCMQQLLGLECDYSLHLKEETVNGCDALTAIQELVGSGLLITKGDTFTKLTHVNSSGTSDIAYSDVVTRNVHGDGVASAETDCIEALRIDRVEGSGCVIHHLRHLKVPQHVLYLLRDAAVLMFGCGFGSSLAKCLVNMCLGLSGFVRFPYSKAAVPYIYFPHKIAWLQYKAARLWQQRARLAIQQACEEKDPWIIKKCVAQVVEKPRSAAGERATATTAFQWRKHFVSHKSTKNIGEFDAKVESWGPAIADAAGASKYTFELPFGNPPVRCLPLTFLPPHFNTSQHFITAQIVHAQEFFQFHCNPVALYAAGLLEAALSYKRIASELSTPPIDGKANTSGELGDWTATLQLQHLRCDNLPTHASELAPQDDLAKDPRALLLEAARLLYFLAQLQRSPCFDDELTHMNYVHMIGSSHAPATHMVVPGVAAGTSSMLPLIWEELVSITSKLGSSSLFMSVAKEAIQYFRLAGLAQRAASIMNTVRVHLSAHESEAMEAWASPSRMDHTTATVKELWITCPRWPGAIVTWSPNVKSSPLSDIGVRDASRILQRVVAASNHSDVGSSSHELSASSLEEDIDVSSKVVFKRGRTHVYHIDGTGAPASVEEIVLQTFTQQSDVMVVLGEQQQVSVYVDSGGTVRTLRQHMGVGTKRRRETANRILFPQSAFESTMPSLLQRPGIHGKPDALLRLFKCTREPQAELLTACELGFVAYDLAKAYASGIEESVVYRVDTLVGQMTPRVTPWECAGNGWRGAHGENVLWSTMFGLFMWDAFGCVNSGGPSRGKGAAAQPKQTSAPSSAADARATLGWKHPWQQHPLDMYFDDFRSARRPALESHFEKLESMSACELTAYLKRIYDENQGALGFRIRWDLFEVGDLCELVHAAGPLLICSVLRQFALSYQSNFAGLPDIVLWKPEPCPQCCLALAVPHERGITVDIIEGATGFAYMTTGKNEPMSFTVRAREIAEHSLRTKQQVSARNPQLAFLEVKSSKDRVQAHQLSWFSKLSKRAAVAVVNVVPPPDDGPHPVFKL